MTARFRNSERAAAAADAAMARGAVVLLDRVEDDLMPMRFSLQIHEPTAAPVGVPA